MGKPYSNDLRERVVAAIEAGRTRVEVAELYNMALSTVGGFIKRKRETGSVRPDKFGGYKTFALEDHTARVRNWWPNNRIVLLRSFKFAWPKKT
jgi:transposase